MQVLAVSTPQKDAAWRWRIVNYAGEVVEESVESFLTIACAIEHGSDRLRQIDVVDKPHPHRPYRWTRHLRVL
jgi:hypothetical protein